MKQLSKDLFIILRSLVKPIAKDKDLARREFILNILLISAIILTSIATLSSFITIFIDINVKKTPFTAVSPIAILFILLLFLCFYIISRRGKFRIVSYFLIAVYFLGATYTMYRWGVDIPQALLTDALIIVMSGILIGTRFAFIATLGITFVTFFLIYAQTNNIITVNTTWRAQIPNMGDIVIYDVTFVLIAVISWLFNRELEKALKRAQRSEAALRKERDLLEIKVEERTRELRQAEMEKVTQLYRFAEFGKLASGIFHDLTTPLSLVSLNLYRLDKQDRTLTQQELSDARILIKRAIYGTKQLEKFVMAARKQVSYQKIESVFSLNSEIKDVIEMLEYKARTQQVKIVFEAKQLIKIKGNPLQFNQVMTNLISNAIDAYHGKPFVNERKVHICMEKIKGSIKIIVKDWGVGIDKKNLDHIFEPFFTTKDFKKGIGLGLSLSHEIIQKNFNGRLTVINDSNSVTSFLITIPAH